MNRGNCFSPSCLLYQKATGDTYPPVTPEEQEKFGPIANRIYDERQKARARQAELLQEESLEADPEEIAQ